MNIINIKSLIKKIIIIFFIFIIVFNLVIPTQVYAVDLGGILLKPVTALCTACIGAVNSVLGILLKRCRYI